MYYQIVKLDGRHSYHDQFNYVLEFSKSTWVGTGVIDFDRSRQWMNRTWGWSQDVITRTALINRNRDPANTVAQADDINPHWAYSVEYKNYRIYLAGDEELMYFQLAHAQDNN
jgi:hypothetical protein